MTRNEYNTFINEKDRNLLRLKKIMNDNGFPDWGLNYSEQSIAELESGYLTFLNEGILFSNVKMDDLILTYIGEASIHYLGGHWTYGDRKNFLGYEKAIIINYKNWEGIPISPENKLKRIKEKNKRDNIWNTIHFILNKDMIEKDLMEQMRNLGKKK